MIITSLRQSFDILGHYYLCALWYFISVLGQCVLSTGIKRANLGGYWKLPGQADKVDYFPFFLLPADVQFLIFAYVLLSEVFSMSTNVFKHTHIAKRQ